MTGPVSGDLGGQISKNRVQTVTFEIISIKLQKKHVYCFQCQDCNLSDLCCHYTQLSFHQQSPCVYASPPAQGVTRVREGWRRRFPVTQVKHERKRNKI